LKTGVAASATGVFQGAFATEKALIEKLGLAKPN
jgi:hypothetical protein